MAMFKWLNHLLLCQVRHKHIMGGGKLLTLSDLYKEDIPGDANFIPYYPTSASSNRDDRRLFFNTKWQINDELIPFNASDTYYNTSNHIIAGERLKIIGAKVSRILIRHWEKSLNDDITVRYGQINEEIPHVEFFPIESVKNLLHAVNPEVHFEISSKSFIAKVPCPQAAVYTTENVQFPCYVKLCMVMGARGVWKVEGSAQLENLLKYLEENIPTANLVINEMIQNAQNTFSAIFYVTKKGEMKWIGVTEPGFDKNGLHSSGTVDMEMQESLELMLAPIVSQIAEAAHQKGYFGVVDVDVVMDDQKQGFVVDINPRVGGTTKLMLIMHYLKSKGYTYGMYIKNITLAMTAKDTIKFAEGFEDGKVVVLNAFETGVGDEVLTQCTFVIYSEDRQICHAIVKKIRTISIANKQTS